MFKEILKELRKEKDISQTELAKSLKLARSTIAQYETGDRTPDYDTLKKIADYFNVSTDYLLGRAMKLNSSSIDEKELSYYKLQYSQKEIEKNIEITKTLLGVLIDTGVLQENEELSDEKRDYCFNLLKRAIVSSKFR